MGTVASALVVGALIWFQGYRAIEKFILILLGAIGLCYLVELMLVKPDLAQTALHLILPRL